MKTKVTKKNTNTNSALNISTIVPLIVDAIQDKKGENIVSLNLSNIPEAIADYFIICQGDSPPQIRAIADNIEDKLKEHLGLKALNIEGKDACEWVLLDFFDIIVHIFRNDTREYYQLEELWADAATSTQYNPDGTFTVENNNLPEEEMIEIAKVRRNKLLQKPALPRHLSENENLQNVK